MSSSFSYEKAWFVISLLVFSFAYGFVSHAWGIFPKKHIETAWQQAYWKVFNKKSINLYDAVYENGGIKRVSKKWTSGKFTFVTSFWKINGEWRPELRLINSRGSVLHNWVVDSKGVFKNSPHQSKDLKTAEAHGSYLLSENGSVLVNVNYVGTVRLSTCGKVIWTLEEGNHHSIERANDGDFWIPGVSQEPKSQSKSYPEGFPGLSGKAVWLDRILRVSPDGEVLKKVNILDILYDNGLEHLLFYGNKGLILPDITHMNDLEPLSPSMADEYPLFESGDLVISLRHANSVFVVNPDSWNIKWYKTGPFIAQHDPDFIGGGRIGIFDNNKERLGGSRVLSIKPTDDSTEVLFPKQDSEKVYTAVQGSFQMLSNENLLISESTAGRVLEVNPNGKIVWEWVHEPNEQLEVPSVSRATRVNLTRKDVASWPCSSVDSVSTSVRTQ